MKIKVGILDMDQSYLNRIVAVFGTKYADKLEIYFFTDMEVALDTINSAKIDVFIANDAFDVDLNNLPKRCGFAYFVDSMDVSMVNNQRVICKFQKAELIYKQILNIYSDKAENLSSLRSKDGSASIILFQSISGGTGASSMAAACSLHFAEQGKKILYVNLEKYGSSDVFFNGEGNFDISDIIYALKSKRSNLSLKLESCLKNDPRGVYFYSQSRVALDMLELNSDEILQLLSELKIMDFDYIVVDMDFAMDKNVLKICRQANAIVWVGDGLEISNIKIRRAHDALSIIEQNADLPLQKRIFLLYNKFSNKVSKALEDIELRNIGGAPRYEHATTVQVLERLSKLDVFDKII